MPLLYAIKRGLAAIALPSVLFALSAYFIWHAQQGERGTLAREVRMQEIAAARVTLDEAQRERDRMERRVQGLRGNEVDRDQLDERARALLNLLGRDEVVMPYGPERRLFQ